MIIRRAMYYWQFIAALVLPSWVLIGRGIIQSDVGWDFVLYLVLCPILCVAMLATAGVIAARKDVRVARAVSWLDVGVVGAWHAAIIVYGFFASTALATVIVALAIVAFWVAAWELFTETRRRVKSAFSLDPITPTTYPSRGRGQVADGRKVIIVHEDGTREELPDR